MYRFLYPAVMCAVLSLAVLPAFAADRVVKLTSLEWPPYTGEALESQGASAAVVKAAFAAVGVEVEITILPWSRAVNTAKDDPEFAGYFPEYYAQSIESDFIFSDPMGEGPLGFVERVDAPVAWSTLDDLKGTLIGVVQDYVNTEAFDAMVASGELSVDVATSDEANLRKVAKGRIPLAVMDENVMRYLLGRMDGVDPAGLQFNATPLEIKKLFVCFTRSPEGEELARLFNQGLAQIDVQAIMDGFMSR